MENELAGQRRVRLQRRMLTKWFNHPIMAPEEHTASRGIFRPLLEILCTPPRGPPLNVSPPSTPLGTVRNVAEEEGESSSGARREEVESLIRCAAEGERDRQCVELLPLAIGVVSRSSKSPELTGVQKQEQCRKLPTFE